MDTNSCLQKCGSRPQEMMMFSFTIDFLKGRG